jgi:hypothetical protein
MGPGIIRLPRPGTGAARRLRAAACALLAALGLAAGSPAQANERATARMGATVLTPISIIDTNDMDFGNIALRGNPGKVTLTADASAQCTTTGGLVHTGNCRAATFEGTAYFLSTLRAKRPNGNSITLSGPAGATMQVDDFTFGAGPGLLDFGQTGANHRFWVLNLTGDYTFYVGGTLHVAADQTPGVYTGTFDIQISYN